MTALLALLLEALAVVMTLAVVAAMVFLWTASTVFKEEEERRLESVRAFIPRAPTRRARRRRQQS